MKDPRGFVKIAVDLPANRKLSGATPAAKWLHIAAICWSGQNLTDGQITAAVVVAVAAVPARTTRELIDRDIWHQKGHACPDCPQPDMPSDLVIHHYLSHQAAASAVRRKKTEKALAGLKGNHNRWNHGGPFEECPQCQES
jgi:5-methylcytosine-specific restriction endonuclease McrA